MAEAAAQPPRLTSLDQFRGYTVLGMFVVNFVGSFAVIEQSFPVLGHHHTYCSYADTIMPQFFFAVGFAYRLTFVRRMNQKGPRAAYRHALRRNFGLLLLAFVIHQLDGNYGSWAELEAQGWRGVLVTAFERNFFQTLTHIALTSMWVMPVIAARPAYRVIYAVLSAGLLFALSRAGYYEWVLRRPGIDGGPLGFLTWTIPLTVGTLAYDAMAPYVARVSSGAAARPPVGRLIVWGAVLMVLAYGLSCLNRVTPPNDRSSVSSVRDVLIEPPFFPPVKPVNIWTMSQRAGSVTYLTFGAGFALAVYGLFVLACDWGPMRVGAFRTLGTNALAGYILHDLVNSAIKPFVPDDSPLVYVAVMMCLSITICYVMLRYLERHRLYLKL